MELNSDAYDIILSRKSKVLFLVLYRIRNESANERKITDTGITDLMFHLQRTNKQTNKRSNNIDSLNGYLETVCKWNIPKQAIDYIVDDRVT